MMMMMMMMSDLALPCSHPGNIDHGLTDWNGTATVARFACYQGYYLVGPPKLVCRSVTTYKQSTLLIYLNDLNIGYMLEEI